FAVVDVLQTSEARASDRSAREFEPRDAVLPLKPLLEPLVGDAIRELLRRRLLVPVGALVEDRFRDAAEHGQRLVTGGLAEADRRIDFDGRGAAEPLDRRE